MDLRMEPVRVLINNTTMDRGGAETLIMNVYREIDRTKVQFDFLLHCDYKSAYENEITSLGGLIYKLPKYRLFNEVPFRNALKKFFCSHPQYHIIHCHLMNSASIVLDEANKCGLHTIAHSHATTNGSGPQAWIRDFLHRNLYRIAEYRFACSTDAGNWLFRGKAPFTIIRNGVDTSKFIYNPELGMMTRKDLSIEPKTIVLGNVGRLSKEKNHSFLLDIFSVFHEKHPDSVLVIVGTGPLLSRLQTKAKRLNLLENIIFTGSRPDVEKMLCTMDVFVFPSLFEGLPVTLIEAQCSGLPCVISDIITTEIDATELLTRISLSDGVETWVKHIEEALSIKRESHSEDIKNYGYDIKTTARELQDFYLNL